VKVGDVTEQRLPPPVEAGAYVAIDEAIRDAAVRHANTITVSAALRNGHLLITADDDGTPRAGAMVHVADRLGALGGALEIASTSLRAEIPCV
jgi:signal transduction histidine kinase